MWGRLAEPLAFNTIGYSTLLQGNGEKNFYLGQELLMVSVNSLFKFLIYVPHAGREGGILVTNSEKGNSTSKG